MNLLLFSSLAPLVTLFSNGPVLRTLAMLVAIGYAAAGCSQFYILSKLNRLRSKGTLRLQFSFNPDDMNEVPPDAQKVRQRLTDSLDRVFLGGSHRIVLAVLCFLAIIWPADTLVAWAAFATLCFGARTVFRVMTEEYALDEASDSIFTGIVSVGDPDKSQQQSLEPSQHNETP